MFALTVIVALFLAAALTLSAFGKLTRMEQALAATRAVGFPDDKVPLLGGLLLVGALGLVIGLFVEWIGVLAAIGVIAYFTAAIALHVRAGGRRDMVPAVVLLVVAVVTLILRAATA